MPRPPFRVFRHQDRSVRDRSVRVVRAISAKTYHPKCREEAPHLLPGHRWNLHHQRPHSMQPQGLQRIEFELAEIPMQRSWFARKTPQACEKADMKASDLAPIKCDQLIKSIQRNVRSKTRNGTTTKLNKSKQRMQEKTIYLYYHSNNI